LFDASYDVLLYNLISMYFECDMPEETDGLRRFGYSRDKRSDCVQVVVALIITPEGFPVACEGGARQHVGSNNPAGVPAQNRSTVRKSQPAVDYGSGHSDRRGP